MKKTIAFLVLTLVLIAALVGCSATQEAAQSSAAVETQETAAAEDASDGASDASAEDGESGIKIGISINDLQLERWQRDWSYMEAACEEAGVEYVSASADGDEQTQMSQIESMLTQGVNALVVIPINQDTLSQAVETAHESNVPVIAYDRLITNCDLDYYITFDMIGVGEEQAKFLIDLVPTGNYFLLEGPQTDSNAQLFYQGQMQVLQPYIDSGDITIVGEQWADDWSEENAMTLTENILTANNNEIDAICAANDSTAGGAIMALEAQGLAGEIPITGQDCDLAACRRIVEGTQTMSVYKQLKNLATTAIESAIAIAEGETLETNDTYNNGFKDVPTVALDLQIATKDNMMDLIIADGFQSYDEVYADIPEDERPPKE
jgi:D-xylose transport system substrate-binding protein